MSGWRNMKFDLWEIKLVYITWGEKRSELIEVGLLEYVALFELRDAIEVQCDPLLYILTSRETLTLRVDLVRKQ